MAPGTLEGTALQENSHTNTGTIMNGEPVYIENESLGFIIDLDVFANRTEHFVIGLPQTGFLSGKAWPGKNRSPLGKLESISIGFLICTPNSESPLSAEQEGVHLYPNDMKRAND